MLPDDQTPCIDTGVKQENSFQLPGNHISCIGTYIFPYAFLDCVEQDIFYQLPCSPIPCIGNSFFFVFLVGVEQYNSFQLHSLHWYFFPSCICLTSCSPVVRALVYQPSGPGSIPGMSCSESAITRGKTQMMLLPPIKFL